MPMVKMISPQPFGSMAGVLVFFLEFVGTQQRRDHVDADHHGGGGPEQREDHDEILRSPMA